MKRTKTPERALSDLMTACAKSEKETSDARRLLARWGVEAQAAEEIVRKLVEAKFIDDRRYAEAYVREKIRLSRWGVRKIREGLRAKRIPEAIVDEALGEADARTMGRKLDELLRRKSRTVKAANDFERKGKLLRYGMGLGFDYEEIAGALDRLAEDARTDDE